MRIAYLLIVHNNPNHLNKLIKALDHENVDFFIHIDKKSNIKFSIPNLKNVYVLKDNLKVYWGSMSFVYAVLRLIKEAFKVSEYDYFILLSGADYPVRSNNYILKYLKKNKGYEYINMFKMPDNNKSLDRIKYYYISNYEKDLKFVNLLKRSSNLLIRIFKLSRPYPKEYRHFILYGGCTWWALTKDCVKYILDFVHNNPKYLKFYENTLLTEEMFFQTIVGNSIFKQNIKMSFTYSDWPNKNSAHPIMISEKHMSVLSHKKVDNKDEKSEILFARKFSDDNLALLNIIEHNLRQN